MRLKKRYRTQTPPVACLTVTKSVSHCGSPGLSSKLVSDVSQKFPAKSSNSQQKTPERSNQNAALVQQNPKIRRKMRKSSSQLLKIRRKMLESFPQNPDVSEATVLGSLQQVPAARRENARNLPAKSEFPSRMLGELAEPWKTPHKLRNSSKTNARNLAAKTRTTAAN